MKAEIITIGDEILIGQITDTNSAWMATELNRIGVAVDRITSISDTREAIMESLDQARKRVNLILMTGGLGPTNDDITKETLAAYFNTSLEMNEPLLAEISKRYEARGIPMIQSNRDQALVPADCRIIPNRYGSAPCMWFEREDLVVVSMPGVPSEMKGIMSNGVLGAISDHFKTPKILHRTVLVQGIGESILADRICTWEQNLPPMVKLAYLPSPGLVRLRLSLTGDDKQELEAIAEDQIQKLQEIVGEYIIGFNDEKLEEIVGQLLRERNQTLSTAESCTGGNIAHLITSHAGSSDFFNGGVVAYSNPVKENVLGVSGIDLEEKGAVSQAVVEQMAEGARKQLNTDYAIATSGIAGPGGGTEEKPVGTVWIAVAGPNKVYAKKYLFSKIRERNIRMASLAGLNLLRKMILGKL
jgi:nicotinamide-nucleotide amidase